MFHRFGEMNQSLPHLHLHHHLHRPEQFGEHQNQTEGYTSRSDFISIENLPFHTHVGHLWHQFIWDQENTDDALYATVLVNQSRTSYTVVGSSMGLDGAITDCIKGVTILCGSMKLMTSNIVFLK